MDDVVDITKEVEKLTEEEKTKIFKNPEVINFSPAPGISIDPSEIPTPESKHPSESLDVSISNVLSQYNDKYGTKFVYDTNLRNELVKISNVSANEREIRRIIDSQIITNMTEILTTKSILVISKVISDQLDRISKLTANEGLSAELVSLVGEMFQWVDKLEEIKSKYQLYDVDSKIKSLLKGESSNNLVRTKDQQIALDALKQLLIK